VFDEMESLPVNRFSNNVNETSDWLFYNYADKDGKVVAGVLKKHAG
jgi:hypothetical protein